MNTARIWIATILVTCVALLAHETLLAQPGGAGSGPGGGPGGCVPTGASITVWPNTPLASVNGVYEYPVVGDPFQTTLGYVCPNGETVEHTGTMTYTWTHRKFAHIEYGLNNGVACIYQTTLDEVAPWITKREMVWDPNPPCSSNSDCCQEEKNIETLTRVFREAGSDLPVETNIDCPDPSGGTGTVQGTKTTVTYWRKFEWVQTITHVMKPQGPSCGEDEECTNWTEQGSGTGVFDYEVSNTNVSVDCPSEV